MALRPLAHLTIRTIVAASCLAPAYLAAQTNHAAAPRPRLDSAQMRAIDSVFAVYDKPDVPGCALGVFENGAIAYGRGYGAADLERPTPITTASLFDIGSTSKQFAAASLAILASEHKLSFSDEVRKYIPELPNYGAPLTIDQMMRHTSGLRDYNGLLALAGHGLEEVTTDSQALALIVQQRHLDFPSGTRFEYSNTNFFLASVIVQRVTGMSLADFARTRLFLPLGMTHTMYRNHFAMLIPNRAMGYAPEGKDGFKNSMSNWEQTGDGALQLSVDDALLWDENFYTARVGGHAMVDALRQRGTLTNGDSIGYARGLFVGKYRGLRREEHGGDWIGYHAAFARFPDQHTSVVVLCNSDGISPGGLSDRVADIVLASAFTAPKVVAAKTDGATHAAATVPATELAGSYYAAVRGEVIRIADSSGTPVLRIVGQSFPLAATGSMSYEVKGLPVYVTFVANGARPAQSLWLRIGSADSTRAERFTEAKPTPVEIRQYAGRYHSPELGVTWVISLDKGQLALNNPPSDLMDITGPLDPAMSGSFTAGGGLLQFTHDAKGRVTGFALSASRMRGITFDRVAP
jgi:CubicO group peptidase (beta-lactamase class C family)